MIYLTNNLKNTNLNYYIIDAARALDRMSEVFAFEIYYDSLYQGRSEEVLADYAPYIIDLKFAEHEFLPWLINNSKGNSWGIFISTKASFEQLYKHLRKFLIVQDEEGNELYFRFYDPRVLRIFLPTCDTVQLKEFFGPIDYFFVESEDPAVMIKFYLEDDVLKTENIDTELFFNGDINN
jgi:hypothetical protein